MSQLTSGVGYSKPWVAGTLVHSTATVAGTANTSLTVPTGKIWKVLGVRATLVNDATVATRTFRVLVTGTSLFTQMATPVGTAASQSCCVEFYSGAAYSTTVADFTRLDTGAAPDVALRKAMQYETYLAAADYVNIRCTANGQAGDSIIYYVDYIEYTV